MSYYPTDETMSDDAPVCPNCGGKFSTDDGDYYPGYGSDATFEDEECGDCGIKVDIYVEMSPTWSITHPNQCEVKGYHVPYISEKHNKHHCLYCSTPLTCDCKLQDECKHNLKGVEDGSANSNK